MCWDFPGGASGKEPACQGRRHKRCGFNPWVRRIPGEGNGNLLQHSCWENPVDWGAGWAMVHGVAKSQTQLKQLSMAVCWVSDPFSSSSGHGDSMGTLRKSDAHPLSLEDTINWCFSNLKGEEMWLGSGSDGGGEEISVNIELVRASQGCFCSFLCTWHQGHICEICGIEPSYILCKRVALWSKRAKQKNVRSTIRYPGSEKACVCGHLE